MTIRRNLGGTAAFDGYSVQTEFATLLPPGAKVAGYVHADGIASVSGASYEGVVYTTLAAALAQCRSGYSDVVIVLPGHTEDVDDATMLDNLVAGTKIIGFGSGSRMPTFSWTATGSQWTVDQADVVISGLQLNVDGANGVVNAIDVTAAGFKFVNNRVRLASGSALKATIGMSLSAAHALVSGCYFYGTATHNVTRGILIDTAVDGIIIEDTVMIASATAANGLISVTAAATNLLFKDLQLYNTHTSSTATIALSDVACDGLAVRVNSGTKANGGTKAAQGITWGTAALVQPIECYCTDVKADSALLSPAASADS